MPIRFRCAFCNQLMGIARRKAGAVVHCPKCNGQVVVPSPIEQPAAGLRPASGGPEGGLFDVSDFGPEFARGGLGHFPHYQAPQEPAAWNNPIAVNAGDEFDVIPIPPARARGVYLSPLVLTGIGILLIMLIGLAFLLGLLIGQSSG